MGRCGAPEGGGGMSAEINFRVSPFDGEIIDQIVDRARRVEREHLPARQRRDALSIRMDIVCVHANGNPLRLEALLAADDFNFAHDLFGIARHLNRTTGQLEDFFSPRFSAPQPQAEDAA